MKKLLLALLLGIFLQQAFAQPPKLTEPDVNTTMEELFTYHVEHKNFSPLLVKRSFKIFIEEFDPAKIYLLEEEVAPFLSMSDKKADAVKQRWERGDFSDFYTLNQVFQQAIERTRLWRRELERTLTLSGSFQEKVTAESYLEYATKPSQLKDRIKKVLLRVLASEENHKPGLERTPQFREKVFALWERRFCRLENQYLVFDSQKQWINGQESEHLLVLHILKAMANSLDAHTAFFSPEEAFEIRASLEKEFEGIGVVLREGIDGVVVDQLIKNGPAEKSGKIDVGDILVEIRGQPLEGLPYEEVLELLQSESDKRIGLGFKRVKQGEKPLLVHVDLVREKIVMDDERLQYSDESFGDGFIGKLTLPAFYEGSDDSSCEKDIREAIKNLKRKGKLLGLVLDLRENSGGFLNQAVKVAGLFITSGVIVISKYAQGEIQYLRDLDGRLYFNGPMLILTSKASASAAEIVAQALQDYGTALVVGDERTYGKGSIQYQTITDQSADTFFKVTVGRYYTVSGKSTQIDGVQADIVVPTHYSVYNIGERFLEYPLESDRISAAFIDPLTDVDPKSRLWFQKNYLPYLQKRDLYWGKMLPALKTNSAYRLENDKNFQLFLKKINGQDDEGVSKTDWGNRDLQMEEAVKIVKDMVIMQREREAFLTQP